MPPPMRSGWSGGPWTAAAGTADARFRSAGFNAPGAAVSKFAEIVEFNVLAFLTQGIEHRFLGKSTQEQTG